MNHRFTSIFWISVISLLAPPANCEGGPLLDWLFRRNRTQTVTAFNAGAAGCCGQGYCEQTVVRYVPQVAYRTMWQPVPVTTYRQSTYCNPQTGLPITCTRPCTTYTYQARRVPYTSYRPVYTKVPVTANFQSAAPVGCNSCSTGFASTAPSYADQSYSAPGYATSGSIPSLAEPNYSTPGATPWRPVPGQGSEFQDDGYSGSESDYGDSVPQIQREDRTDDLDQGAMPRRLSRMPSTRSRYTNRDSYYRSRSRNDDRERRTSSSTATRSILTDAYRSSAARVQRDLAQDPLDNNIVRHHTLDREALKPMNELDELGNKFRNDIKPFPNLDPPLNERVPAFLDFPNNEDREARRRVRPVPAQWAANAIAWNRVVRASYQPQQEEPRLIEVQIERSRFSSEDQDMNNQTRNPRRSRPQDDDWQSMHSR